MLVLAGALSLFLLLFNLPREESADEQKKEISVPDKPVDAVLAEQNYKASCLSCHGDQLQGGMGPALDKIGATADKEDIYEQIVRGGGGMPAFEGRLSEDEIVNLTNWLAAMKG